MEIKLNENVNKVNFSRNVGFIRGIYDFYVPKRNGN